MVTTRLSFTNDVQASKLLNKHPKFTNCIQRLNTIRKEHSFFATFIFNILFSFYCITTSMTQIFTPGKFHAVGSALNDKYIYTVIGMCVRRNPGRL